MHIPILIIVFVAGYTFSQYKSKSLGLHPTKQQATTGVTTVRGIRALPAYTPISTVQPQVPAGQQLDLQKYQVPITVGIASGLGVELIGGLFA